MSPSTTTMRDRRGADEQFHELRAALFGIEASAVALAHHHAALDDDEFDALAHGLASEIRRIGTMLEGTDGEVDAFDLGAAIAPAITCARATGVRIDADVPPGVRAIGRPDHAAQVVTGLIDNARHHACDSRIEIWITIQRGWVRLHVGDRGPETRPAHRCSARHRSGSGLGLHVARRLMSAVDGTIQLRRRASGGTIVEVAFRSGGTL